MPALEVRTPFTRSPGWQVAPGTWRKKVLPVGEVRYKGRMLKFTPEYLEEVAAAYADGAYDQVPFQIADAANTHTNHPEQFRGEITGMDVADDGLYVTVQTTGAGSRLLANNPKLGVSARIVEGYDRSDGKFYPAAIQHVLGTLDPRIPGLGAWQAVEMANAAQHLVDLSTASFAGEEGTMPDLNTDQEDRLARLLELDPDKLGQLIDGIGTAPAAPAQAGDGSMTDDELVSLIGEMDDETFAAMLAEYEIEPPVRRPAALAGAALSNDYGGLGDVELANYRIAETERQMAAVQGELDRQRFANEKRQLMNIGVPGYICDLAQPLLEGAGHVVELSNGSGVDAGRLMREVLQEFGKAAAMLDLSGEVGSAMDEPDTSQSADQARMDFVKDYRRAVGI